MPRTSVLFYREDDGNVPLLEWFEDLPSKAIAKCRLKIERLRELGHELRRPEADYLRDSIYELRVSLQGLNYRMLYFFHGSSATVVSHGIAKERRVPAGAIDIALQRRIRFEQDPHRHTYEES